MKRYLSNCLPENACVRAAALYLLIAVMCLGLATSAFTAEIYYGVIQDEDGYSNVRKGPGAEYEVVDTLYDAEEFLYEPQESNWWKVYRIGPKTYPRVGLTGYLHRSRIFQTDSIPTVRSLKDTDRQRFSSEYISILPPSGINKAALQYGIVKVQHQEYNLHDDIPNFYLYTGPGKKYRKTVQRWDGYPYLYKPDSSDWEAVYNPADTVFVGYAPKNDIEQVSGSGRKTYYISYFDEEGEEIGFMGSSAPGWGWWGDSYFIAPDTSRNEWLVAYKEILFSPGSHMAHSETMLETVREDMVSVDGLSIMKSPCLLYKSMTDYSHKGIDLLRSYFQRLPIYTDSSFVEKNRTNQYLPSFYNPIPYKPLFGKYFEDSTLDFLNSNYGSYSLYTESFETDRISFQVTVQQEPCYMIYYYLNATFLLSRNKFRNVDFPQLNLGEEFEEDIGEVFSLDTAAILKQYGEPIFMNEDIIIYLTAPQRQLFCKARTNLYRGLDGKIEESTKGIIFFEIEDDKVIVAGSTMFSHYRRPLMYYNN